MPDVPCPHCGRLNEVQRETCWACFGLMKPGPARAAGAARAIPGVVRTPGPSRWRLALGPFTFVIRQYGSTIKEPLGPAPTAPMPPPDGLRFDDQGGRRQILWHWLSWHSMRALVFAAIFAVPFAFVLYIYGHSPAGSWPSWGPWMLALLAAPSAFFFYGWVAYLLNRTVVEIDAARVTVQHGPLPWPGGRDVLKTAIAGVFCERWIDRLGDTTDGTAFEPRVTYAVSLLLEGGKTLTLVSGLHAPEQALFIEQQIRRA